MKSEERRAAKGGAGLPFDAAIRRIDTNQDVVTEE
jgi:hypothetical protein